MSYALNDAAPVEMNLGDKRGEYMISEKPDHRFMAWMKIGKLTLKEGANKIAIDIHGDIANSGGIDCLLFDQTGFVPSGVLKPGGAGLGSAGVGSAAVAGPDEAIWIEGEAADTKDVVKHVWYDAVKKDAMSGGDWLSHYDPAKAGSASYRFNVEKADGYTFWLRGNPLAAKLSYDLNGAGWKPIDFAEKRGELMLSEKPDHRFLAWTKVGTVQLPAGANTIALKIDGDINHSGGIDCFCFTRVPFVPSGADKPTSGQDRPARSDEWFSVVFDADPFSPESVIDMSRYVPAPAGKQGFLQRDGERLKFAQATEPVQFWGCGANLQGNTFSREQLTQRARYCASTA